MINFLMFITIVHFSMSIIGRMFNTFKKSDIKKRTIHVAQLLKRTNTHQLHMDHKEKMTLMFRINYLSCHGYIFTKFCILSKTQCFKTF